MKKENNILNSRILTCFVAWISFTALHGQTPRLVIPFEHTGLITTIAYSSNGHQILTASKDNSAKLWDAASGSLLASLIGHKKAITSTAISPNGEKIITGSDDNTVIIWDSKTGKSLFTIKNHSWGITQVSFSPICTSNPNGGEHYLSASPDGTVNVGLSLTGEVLHTFNHSPSWIQMASFSSDGNKIIMGTTKDSIFVYDVHSFQLIQQFQTNIEKLKSFEIHPKKDEILCYFQNGVFQVWNYLDGNLIQSIQGHTSDINVAHYNPEGTIILSAGYDENIKFWNSQTGQMIQNISGIDKFTRDAVFNSSGTWFAVPGSDYNVLIGDIESGLIMHEITGLKSAATALQFSPDGKFLAYGTNNGPAAIESLSGLGTIPLTGKVANLTCGEISPDGKMALLSNYYNSQLWDLEFGQAVATLSDASGGSEVHFSNSHSNNQNESFIISCSYYPTIINIKSGNTVAQFRDHKGFASCAITNHNGTIAASGSNDKTVRLWDIHTAVEQLKISDFGSTVESVRFSPDDLKIVATSQQDSAKVFDTKTGELLVGLAGHRYGVIFADFNPSGSKIVTTSFDRTAKIWNSITGKLLLDLKGHSAGVRIAAFSPKTQADPEGGKYLATGSDDYSIKLWNTETGENLGTFEGHKGNIVSLQFSKDGKKLFSVSNDRTSKIWEISGLQPEVTMLRIGNQEYFTLNPQGYYRCSQNAAKSLHYVTSKLEIISFEQLDLQYNRPDLLLKSIGMNDTLIIQSLYKAYIKRITKQGVDTVVFQNQFQIPTIQISNLNEIEYRQFNESLDIKISAIDSNSTLKSFNIWVNDVPIYGQKGKLLSNNSMNFSTVEKLTLSEGLNRIEAAVTNSNGIESYKMPLVVNYVNVKPKQPTVYFIGLGVANYQNSDYNLLYSVKDITDLGAAIKKQNKGHYKSYTLFNNEFTAENILKLKAILNKTNVEDKVIIAYSGHGLLSSENDYFLSTSSIDFEHPEINGIPYEALENLLDSIPARQKLMLIDACHSGEVDKDEAVHIQAMADSLGLSKGSKIRSTAPPAAHLGLNNSFELMQELFVNVGKGTGATIISASTGSQFALERGDLQNGVFTYSILEAIANHSTMTVSELKSVVGLRVVELTNGLQRPTSRNETINNDWNVW